MGPLNSGLDPPGHYLLPYPGKIGYETKVCKILPESHQRIYHKRRMHIGMINTPNQVAAADEIDKIDIMFTDVLPVTDDMLQLSHRVLGAVMSQQQRDVVMKITQYHAKITRLVITATGQ